MFQHGQLFGPGTENGAPSAARSFRSKLSLKNFLNCPQARQEVLREYSGIGKRILLKKCRTVRPHSQGRPPGAWGTFTGEVTASKFLGPDFDLGPAEGIVSECGHEFLVDLL
jgi:hypothetical protein